MKLPPEEKRITPHIILLLTERLVLLFYILYQLQKRLSSNRNIMDIILEFRFSVI